jgi:hypothetical protein
VAFPEKKVQKTDDDAIPLPDPFPLPKHYQTNVEEALKSGKMLTRERRMFLSDIASAMLRYKRYPSRDDYVSVACAVIQAYPFLKSTSGRPYDAIVQGLVNRFKEFRRDKSKPRTKPSVTTNSDFKDGKSPGITKRVRPPLLQVYKYALNNVLRARIVSSRLSPNIMCTVGGILYVYVCVRKWDNFRKYV